MDIKWIQPKETPKKTMEYINENRNWSVEKQAYKVPFKLDIELTHCKIYQRGKYLIAEHQEIIHFWERADTNYPYFKMAIEYMDLDRPAKWKTLDKLISLRMGIRQTEVNLCGYVESILDQKGETTLNRYNHFMQLARKQDLEHHGDNTF